MKNFDELYRIADEARKRAHAPYSKITVGSALLCKSGKIYTGANIENSAFSPSVCAERVAFFTAVHAGEREFVAIAVAGGKENGHANASFPPCGVCRQVMAEFCSDDFKVVFGPDAVKNFSEILPYRFSENDLK